MTIAQVQRSDTIETQRQKINQVISRTNDIAAVIESPKELQTIREDFAAVNYMYDPALAPFEYQPTPYFRYSANTTDGFAEWQKFSGGKLGLTGTVDGVGGVSISAFGGEYMDTPWSVSTDYQSFETRVTILNTVGSESPKLVTRIGFTKRNYINGSALTLDARTAYGAFFEITALANSNEFVVPTLRAVVVNDQSPTGTVIHDVAIPGSIFGNATVTQWAVLKVVVTNASVKFYVNGTLASEFVTTNFAGAPYYFYPFVHQKMSENGDGYLGGMATLLDFISIQSKVSR